MALKLERYDVDWDESEMVAASDGEWVWYEDHEDLLYLAERRREAVEPEKAPDWLVQAKAEAAESKLQEAQDAARRWEEAWHEGDAVRLKLAARISEICGERRDADARARKAETELAEARKKLSSVGWVRDVMTRACPGWQRQFAAHAGDRWTEGDTTADEQLAWVLNRLVGRVRSQGRTTGFEEG